MNKDTEKKVADKIFEQVSRRDFLGFFVLGSLLGLVGKKAKSNDQPREAMHWKKVDGS